MSVTYRTPPPSPWPTCPTLSGAVPEPSTPAAGAGRHWIAGKSGRLGLLGSLLAAGCLGLAGCGGGGGSDTPTAVSGPGAPPATPGRSYSVSGSISINQLQTVDTDTNDPKQLGRRANNTFGTVQPLPNPGLATGYLTVAGRGPDGPVKAAGDVVDGYSVRLQAGQVVELDFSASPAEVDVDLYLYNANRDIVGMSIGVNSYECIQIAAEGDYVVAAQLYTDGSSAGTLYQMRVNPPGGTRCANVQTAASAFDADAVIAVAGPTTSSPVMPAAKAYRAGLTVLDAGASASGGAMLLAVPDGEQAMARVLAAHSRPDAGLGTEAVLRKALADARGDEGWRADISDRARRALSSVELAKSLVRSGQYAAATPNRRLKLQAMPAFPPNDRFYSVQRWHYELIGLPAAANRLAGFTPAEEVAPIVGVVDSGIVADHPDLAGQLVAGYDFVAASANGDGDGIDPDPDDPVSVIGWVFHGTHVAGTIAAVTNNSIGVAGVAPVSKIMPVRALYNSENGSPLWDIQQAIAFAARLPNASGTLPARRSDVINLSLGAQGWPCDSVTQGILNQARAGGSWVVVAAGNESAETPHPVGMPGNCANVITVGAVDAQRNKVPYSNAGPEVMVAAPGGDMTKQTTGNPWNDGVLSTLATIEGGSREPSYGLLQGTSMATPHVAGVLALIRWINPRIGVETVEQWIRDGRIVDDLGTPGRDVQTGYGLINAEKAVIAALESLRGGTPTPGGRVSAQPTALNLGSVGQTVEFSLVLSGTATEQIASVTTDAPSITVAPKAGAVDGTSGLGTYVVTANRAAMADNSSAFPNVVIQLSPARTLTVPVTIERRAAGAGAGASAGPLYVLVIDASDGQRRVVAQADVPEATNGVYPFTLTVPGTPRISIMAGSDLDNDGLVCAGGEVCGAYPNLSGVLQVLEPTGNHSGIDFPVVPSGGVNAGSALPGAPRQP